jgi:hypothetical protein
LETLKYAKLFMLLSFSAATLIANGQESAIRKSVTAVLFDTDLRGRFESEQRDNEWAAEMEDSVRTAVTQLETQELQLEEIHCRATVCRSVLGHSSTIEDINDDARREILRRIGDALRPTIEASGRLDAWSASFDADASAYVFLVYDSALQDE